MLNKSLKELLPRVCLNEYQDKRAGNKWILIMKLAVSFFLAVEFCGYFCGKKSLS